MGRPSRKALQYKTAKQWGNVSRLRKEIKDRTTANGGKVEGTPLLERKLVDIAYRRVCDPNHVRKGVVMKALDTQARKNSVEHGKTQGAVQGVQHAVDAVGAKVDALKTVSDDANKKVSALADFFTPDDAALKKASDAAITGRMKHEYKTTATLCANAQFAKDAFDRDEAAVVRPGRRGPTKEAKYKLALEKAEIAVDAFCVKWPRAGSNDLRDSLIERLAAARPGASASSNRS